MSLRLKHALIFCCLAGLTGSGWCQASGRNPRNFAALTIAASTIGRFSKGASWYLSVNTAGQAELIVERSMRTAEKRRTFQITPDQIEQLEQAMEREKFFDLAPELGQSVPDGSWDTLTIVQGGRAHTVRIGYLMNWVKADQENLREPARAVRVFRVVRSWFNEAEAVDLTQYDRMVLDAAPN